MVSDTLRNILFDGSAEEHKRTFEGLEVLLQDKGGKQMTTKRMIIIERCNECWHFNRYNKLCTNFDIPYVHATEYINDPNDIPDWCPLENAEGPSECEGLRYEVLGERGCITGAGEATKNALGTVFGSGPLKLRESSIPQLNAMKAVWATEQNPYQQIIDLIMEHELVYLPMED